MQHEPSYERETITFEYIKKDLKPYIKSGDVDLIVKEALKETLNEMGVTDAEQFSIRSYAVYLRSTLINKVSK